MAQAKILVIEDDRDIREALKDGLEIEGYPVTTVCDGKEAIKYLERDSPPGLILLDLMMPGMNGWEFLEYLKSKSNLATIPVGVVTAAGKTKLEGLNTEL